MMTRFFLSAYDYFSPRRRLFFTLLLLLAVLLAFAASGIGFEEDISRFLPGNRDNERISSAYRYVASSNTVTVYCNSGGEALSEAAVTLRTAAIDTLAERLRTGMDASRIKSLFYRIDPAGMLAVSSFIVSNMPYFLEEEDYDRMDTLLTREAIARQLRIDREVLTSSAGRIVRDHFLSDPLQMTGRLMRKLQDSGAGDQFRLHDGYLFDDENRAVMFIDCAIPVSEAGRNAAFLDSLQRLIAGTEAEFEGRVTFETFGAAEIGLANSRQIQADTVFSMTLAVLLILALLVCTFRSGWKILLIFIPVLFGGLFALAMLRLISGEVSVIAVGISSIMFGIAINYPLHFMEHYGHAPDPRRVLKDITGPLTTGNITTVGAFLSLVFIGSDAMRDLGLFASLLLVGTVLFVLLFLPHLLPPHGGHAPAEDRSRFGRLIARPFEQDRRLALAVILLTVFFSFFSGDSRFETDMRKINYMTAPQKDAFDRMTGLLNGNRHVMYFVAEGDSPEEALVRNEEYAPVLQSLVEEGEVYRIGGIGGFLPSQRRQARQIERWNAFWHARRDSVLTSLREESRRIGFSRDAFRSFEETLARAWEPAGLPYFDPLRETLAKNLLIEKEGRTMAVSLLYTDARRAEALEERLNGEDARVMAFDAGSVTRRMIASLSGNFNEVLYVCGLIVFAFLFFSFGRIELSLIAFLPLALSWIWILGLMNLFDIRFNIVNIILATFIFGQGDDYTIFMTEGLMHEYTYRRRMLASCKKSIALSALIMLAGMGMLVFARHPALRSLAEVTVVGMFSVVIMACILPSRLFRLLTVKNGKKRRMPVTLKNLSCTAFAFLFFLVASAAITFAGWCMFTFGRGTEKTKRKYHRLLYRIARFVIRHIPQVQTAYRNLSGETFDRPGVIICNHQSHIDLMCIMMLTPRLIILTNDWAWNSPFYGRMIRYAGFYPVSGGIEQAMGRLREAVDRGYSIVIFPEGTRSTDCSIRRFHRGAFYLAEQLHLDIIPVMLHGVGHVLPRDEFMLRKGRIHIRVMPRITPGDPRFRKDYSPRSLDVRHYYQAEYEKLVREIETPDYYADLVIKNYIYKGPAIERAVRRNLRRRRNYAAEIAAMPDTGEVTLQNTGYGEYALLLSLVKKNLQITAIEPDPDIRALAENCPSIPANLRFSNV
ncbi:MAG: 1-acyl-sn-glycerol-3-phosphate acyltransferase [Tannerella sp.]|jgi:1-acyl-sn-glycerol-3-phosphate acyltransferase|nr:1-acyl-sn-glycerol-3-phosphate acyltransferase [Tannerella sp.]